MIHIIFRRYKDFLLNKLRLWKIEFVIMNIVKMVHLQIKMYFNNHPSVVHLTAYESNNTIVISHNTNIGTQIYQNYAQKVWVILSSSHLTTWKWPRNFEFKSIKTKVWFDILRPYLKTSRSAQLYLTNVIQT